MHPTHTPRTVSASQFEDLSRELFIGLQRAAKMRMASASQLYPLVVLPHAEGPLKTTPPISQAADLVH